MDYKEIIRKLHNGDFEIDNRKEIVSVSYNIQPRKEKNIFELMASCCKYVYEAKGEVPEEFWRDLLNQAEAALSSLSRNDKVLYDFFNNFISNIIQHIEVCWSLGQGDERAYNNLPYNQGYQAGLLEKSYN